MVVTGFGAANISEGTRFYSWYRGYSLFKMNFYSWFDTLRSMYEQARNREGNFEYVHLPDRNELSRA